MSVKHTERLSRRRAAERLTDVAYALVVPEPVTLHIDGEPVLLPDVDELLVQWDVGYADGRLELQLQVRWPVAR